METANEKSDKELIDMNIINTLTSRKYYKSAFLFVVFLNTLGIGYFDMDITFLYIMLIFYLINFVGVLDGFIFFQCLFYLLCE